MWNDSLLREIAVVLAIKFILLVALWHLFFSQPLHQHLDAVRVSQALIAATPHAYAPAQEIRHDH